MFIYVNISENNVIDKIQLQSYKKSTESLLTADINDQIDRQH
jgi:hypothetical protein